MRHNDILRSDIMTYLTNKQIYTYKCQYTIRLTKDNTNIK